MATTARTPLRSAPTDGVKYVSQAEGRAILDRQARKYLRMSGDEFVKKYRSGQLGDADRSAVLRVAMLIPLADK
ncbi:MAG: hypothetical protein M3Q71_08590 [Chloroflexota bacterium]|nr:hypothetical protein [Chloroflexota bacterium]